MNAKEFAAIIKKTTTPLKGSFPSIKTYRLRVKKRFDGMTILDFYTTVMPNIPHEIWREKIESQNLTVEGNPVKTDHIIKVGALTQHFSKPLTEPNVNTNIELLDWHVDFIVLNKPAPLPIHSGGRFEKNTLIEILRNAFPYDDFKPVHRIDANTTGLIVIAKNKKTANSLIDQFKNQTIQKEYLTLVEGTLDTDFFILNDGISKELMTSGSRKACKNGKQARTEIRVLQYFPNKNQTLLSVIPRSGRTNQIRIHLANIGHPIVGDIGYKDPNYFKNNPLTYSQDCLFLHAWKLTFSHKNEKRTYLSDIPAKFKLSSID